MPAVRGNHSLLNRGTVPPRFFLQLAPLVGGENLDMAASQVSSYERSLFVEEAVMRCSLPWRTREGARLEQLSERVAQMRLPLPQG